MTLKFNRVLEIVVVHVRASFRQAKCDGLWVILWTEKERNGEKNYDRAENNTADATAGSSITHLVGF